MMYPNRFFYEGMNLGHSMLGSIWFWLIAIGLLIAVVAVVVMAAKRRSVPERNTDALEILDIKFARGEITIEEYNMRKKIINEGRY